MNVFAKRGLAAGLRRGSRPDKRPRTVVAALFGTFVCFVAFVHHYTQVRDDSIVWVWFGMRSDGRCGRDFATDSIEHTTCGQGLCCSSHGWCGDGEEYCSVSLGCQNGCWPVDEEEQAKIDAQGTQHDGGGHTMDDDDHYKSRHYRYDDDGGHRHRYRDYHHHHHYNDRYDDYHHRYDDPGDDPDLDHRHDDHHHDDHGDHYDSHEFHDDHRDHHRYDGDDGDEGDGPELVGLHEKEHLGHGEDIPLEGEPDR